MVIVFSCGGLPPAHDAEIDPVQTGLVAGQAIKEVTKRFSVLDLEAAVHQLRVERMNQHQGQDLLVRGDWLLQEGAQLAK